jgi:hypothetical protein
MTTPDPCDPEAPITTTGPQGEIGPKGEQGPPGPVATDVTPVAVAIHELTKAARRYVIAMILFVVLGIAIVLGGFKLISIESALHNDVTNNCIAGNNYRQGDYEGWQKFVTLILANNHKPAAHAAGANFLAYIAGLDKPRDCSHISGLPVFPNPDPAGVEHAASAFVAYVQALPN